MCRGGHIAWTLLKHGYDVSCIDIVDRGYPMTRVEDYLKNNGYIDCDVITNPPYSQAKEFVEHTLNQMQAGCKCAFFLKLTFLEGEKRRSLFQKYPPKKIYVFTKRVNCALNGNEEDFARSSAVCYAWFIWEKGSKTLPVIDWI